MRSSECVRRRRLSFLVSWVGWEVATFPSGQHSTEGDSILLLEGFAILQFASPFACA